MKDLNGPLLIEIRDGPTAAPIHGGRVTVEDRGVDDDPPLVVIRELDVGRGAPDNRRIGLQTALHAAFCYGPRTTDSSGRRTARNLAGAVSDDLHGKTVRTTSGALFYLTETPRIGPALTDPDTEEPYRIVTIESIAAAPAVT